MCNRAGLRGLEPTHNPKVAGSNPAPATIDDEGLADAAAANPFRLPRLHPGIGRAAGDAASRTAAQKPSVWPRAREQRDWFHKLGNILDELPKRLQLRVKAALREVIYSETHAQVREAVRRFAVEYGPKYPEALMTLEKDADVLLTFFDFPAEHWKHLRTSNVVEPPFATVRLRQRVTKGAGSRTKGL